jgi:hypothetical protein
MAVVLIVVGVVLLTAGAAWVYPPAGPLVAGTLALAFGLDLARDVVSTEDEAAGDRS